MELGELSEPLVGSRGRGSIGETERGSTSHRYYLCSPGFGTYRRFSFFGGILPVGLLSPIHASMRSALQYTLQATWKRFCVRQWRSQVIGIGRAPAIASTLASRLRSLAAYPPHPIRKILDTLLEPFQAIHIIPLYVELSKKIHEFW